MSLQLYLILEKMPILPCVFYCSLQKQISPYDIMQTIVNSVKKLMRTHDLTSDQGLLCNYIMYKEHTYEMVTIRVFKYEEDTNPLSIA